MDDFLKTKSYEVIGACMNVHNELGAGFLESVYQEALAFELKLLDIPFKNEVPLKIKYKGVILEKYYIADFICYDDVIVELKALNRLEGCHKSQVINYLQATGFDYGLLINFGAKSLQHEKINNLILRDLPID